MRVLLSIFCLFFSSILYANINIDFWKTENGVRVYFVESHELPIVDIKINFDAGSARDPKGQYGVANLTNYLMLLGAGDLDENQISNRFSDIGATLGGGIDRDHAELSIRTLSDKKIFSQVESYFVSRLGVNLMVLLLAA
jgi:zinc protease